MITNGKDIRGVQNARHFNYDELFGLFSLSLGFSEILGVIRHLCDQHGGNIETTDEAKKREEILWRRQETGKKT